MRPLAGLFGLALLATVASATAAPISGIVTVNASGFQPSGNPDAATIVFAIAFDNASDIENQTTGIDLLSSTLALGSPLSFTYEAAGDNLFVGGLHLGADQAIFQTDDFILTIGAISTAPIYAGALYTRADSFDNFISQTGTVTKVDTATQVPEPASLALFGLAVAGLGLVRRRIATA